MTVNAALVKSDLERDKNGYLRLILLPKKYNYISSTAFFRLPNMGRMATVLEWRMPVEEKRLL